MKWVCWADLHLDRAWLEKEKYLEVRAQIMRPGDSELFMGDTFEGYVFRLNQIFRWHPELIQLWIDKGTYFLIGNHEWFQQAALFETFGNRVFRDCLIAGVKLFHGDIFDPNQNSDLEKWLAMEGLQFYKRYPNVPVLDAIYYEVTEKHRTNMPLLAGMEKEGIRKAGFGHSHRALAWWDENEGIAYYNPGPMKNKLTALILHSESGEMHLESF